MMDERLEKLKSGGKKEVHGIGVKELVIVILVGAFALHLDLSSQTKETNEKIDKVDKRIDYVLFQNQSYEKNMKTLAGTACGSCHLAPSMTLPKSSLSMDQFMGYVRGTNRFNQNSQMPKFDQSMISDAELEKLWKGLY